MTPEPAPEEFDAVIVGSGFGGSVTALRLAERGLKVCVLERGRAYAPGSFPRTPREFAAAFWDPSAGLTGLYDVWSFKRLTAVCASGLGGGSLIYANVLLRKDPGGFAEQTPDPSSGESWPWPITREELERHYDRVEAILDPQPFPVGQQPYDELVPKAKAFRVAAEAAGYSVEQPPLAIRFARTGDPEHPQPGVGFDAPADNLHGVERQTCRLCGECDVGCNYGSKQTLDLTYLSLAQQHGAAIRTRTEVRSFAPRPGGGFTVHAIEHPECRDGRLTATSDEVFCPPVTLTCKRLILAAGAIGTTNLLLRNRSAFPQISAQLGTRYSSNGDYLSFVRHASEPTSGSTTLLRPLDPSRGPVITTTVREPAEAGEPEELGAFFLQDAGYPAFASWLLQLVATPKAGWRARGLLWKLLRSQSSDRIDPEIGATISTLLGDMKTTAGHLPLLGMGRERANGRFTLSPHGVLELDWSAARAGPVFDRIKTASRAVAAQLGGGYLDDPVGWDRGRTISVHSLGGAPMGHSADDGVVDSYGRVFGYPKLTVACGAALPGSVGANPSLTIAAFADRQADQILEEWFAPGGEAGAPAQAEAEPAAEAEAAP